MLRKLKRLDKSHYKSFWSISLLIIPAVVMIYSQSWFVNGETMINNHGIFASSPHQNSYQKAQYLTVGLHNYSDSSTNSKYETYPNEGSIRLDNESALETSSLPAFWVDPSKSCSNNFECVVNFTMGWNDNKSIQITSNTVNNARNILSSIIGQEVQVTPNERYELVVHMKTQSAIGSHVGLQGFNESSEEWYQIEQCPPGSNQPIKWEEYKCVIPIEVNITKVRPVLNAGWSTHAKTKATTWFDLIYMNKLSPSIHDPNLTAELVYKGLEGPVSMAFLAPNDFLVAENKGTVQRITNGQQVSNALVSLDVAENQGLLGITIQKTIDRNQSGSSNDHTYVYLYYTANEKVSNLTQGKDGVSNRLYRYELVEDKLVNPKKLLELPAEYDHNGGPLLIGPDKNSVYLSIGDLENQSYKIIPHKALNNSTGMQPDGSGGILRVTLDGEPVNGGFLGTTYPLNLYYAYGIRECFGMDFDPLTGALWNTENGANWGDEINLVNEGFNGGWNKVQGIWRNIGDDIPSSKDIDSIPADLVYFDGKGKYRSPEFTWNQTVGPTALRFLSTDKLGKQYENDMLVADVNNGRIYHFDLNANRTHLLLQRPLSDKVADNDEELQNMVFAEGFGMITDLKIDPDGNLYVVVFNEGKIYRISPL